MLARSLYKLCWLGLAIPIVFAAFLQSDKLVEQPPIAAAVIRLDDVWPETPLLDYEPFYHYGVGSLPCWQQRLLSDPGWNQPIIPPSADTPILAPTYEQLMEETAKARAKK